MDFNISVLFFPIVSEKSLSALDAVFANTNPRDPLTWCQDLARHDPHESYVVVELSHQKRLSLAHGQHEFTVFDVEPRHYLGSPPRPRYYVEISRTIDPTNIPAKLGLWGPASDTITVTPNPPNPNERVYHQIWTPQQATSLRKASYIMLDIHDTVPQYSLLSTPCYTFARATTDAVCLFANGTNNPQPHRCCFKRSYFLGIVPVGSSKSKGLAEGAVKHTWNVQVAQWGPQEQQAPPQEQQVLAQEQQASPQQQQALSQQQPAP